MEYNILGVNSENSIDLSIDEFNKLKLDYNLPTFVNKYGTHYIIYNGFLFKAIL